VERGTFSHRHAVVVDQNTQERHVPLNNLTPTQASFSVSNSHLSEFGVLGFELGYSMENPRSLVCWEAQFGDFANGAQVIIDQFLVAGEKKWDRQTGLTMLLPHAYEGAGPEHSSCRVERFLQSVDEDADTFQADWETQLRTVNMWVGNFSTPANYFHALRRQNALNYRKPLVIATPKALLRDKACRSQLTDIVCHLLLCPRRN
jgi:2-oxoglutarate dehydrogenase E1 component